MPHDIESACASLLTLLEQLKHQGQLTNCTYKLYLNIQKTKIMVSGPIASWQKDGETMEIVTDFLGSKITADGDYSHEIKRQLLLVRKAMTNLDSIIKSRGPSSQGYGFSSSQVWM